MRQPDDHQLWQAVILRQIEDATSIKVPDSGSQKESDRLRKEARKWLTIPNDDFDEVCYLAGLNPEWVRNGAIQKIEEFERNKHTLQCGVKTYTHEDGRTHSIPEWAKVAGISHNTIRSRLRSGMSITKAVSLPTGLSRVKTYTHEDGRTHSLSEWSRISGIHLMTLHDRLRRGMSLTDALSTPIKRTSSRKSNVGRALPT